MTKLLMNLSKKIEMALYKAALVVTGAIKRTSCDKLYQKRGLEPLADGIWFRRVFFFHKIISALLKSYIQTYHNAVSEGAYLTHSTAQDKVKPIPTRTKWFENSFFPYYIKEWSKHNDKIRNIKSITKFKVTILYFIRPKGNSAFDINDTNGIKLFIGLRLHSSHLNEHKFWYNFNDTLDPMWS